MRSRARLAAAAASLARTEKHDYFYIATRVNSVFYNDSLGKSPTPVEMAEVVAPFSFQTRRGKLDWRSISKIDLDRVAREVDIVSLEHHLKGVALADVTVEGACRTCCSYTSLALTGRLVVCVASRLALVFRNRFPAALPHCTTQL